MEPRIDAGIYHEDDPSPRPPSLPEGERREPADDLAPVRTLPLGPLSLLVAGVALVLSLWNLWSAPAAPPPVGEQAAVALTADQAARLEKRVTVLEHLLATVPPGADAKEGDRTRAARLEKLKMQVEDLYQRMVVLERRLTAPSRAAIAPRPAAAPAARKAAPAARTAKAARAKSAHKRVVYKVRRGDSLWGIAKRYGVKVSRLRAWNPRMGSRIKVGQRVIIYLRRK